VAVVRTLGKRAPVKPSGSLGQTTGKALNLNLENTKDFPLSEATLAQLLDVRHECTMTWAICRGQNRFIGYDGSRLRDALISR
jgi:hypothetical protein